MKLPNNLIFCGNFRENFRKNENWRENERFREKKNCEISVFVSTLVKNCSSTGSGTF
jgi:hypothetical protein